MNERSHVITGVELNFDLTRRRSLEDSLLDLSIHQHPLIDPIRDDRIQNSNANTCVYMLNLEDCIGLHFGVITQFQE